MQNYKKMTEQLKVQMERLENHGDGDEDEY